MKCGLVLEGGARRCMFTAGVTDVWLKEGIYFPYIGGVSAGAMSAMNYVTEQIGRTKYVMTPEFPKNELKGTRLRYTMDSELKRMVFSCAYKGVPFDFRSYFRSDVVNEIVVTSCDSGEAEYMTENGSEEALLKIVKASGSVPGLFPLVEIDGRMYVDGSISDSIPFDRAFEMGCDRVVVIQTKMDNDECTDYRKGKLFLSRMFKNEYPLLYERLMDRYDRYQVQNARLHELAQKGDILLIQPEIELVGAFEFKKNKLTTNYEHGTMIGQRNLKKVLDFMKE